MRDEPPAIEPGGALPETQAEAKAGGWLFRPVGEAAARTIARWRYDPPYDVYNHLTGEEDEAVRCYLDPAYHYFGVWDEKGNLAGFLCFGQDARVPGGNYGDDALDVGGGLRPDLTGCGLGPRFLLAAAEMARRRWAPAALRVTVAAFNVRALRAAERAGFRRVQSFAHARTGQGFVVLLRAESP